MKVIDYKDQKAMESTCGALKESFTSDVGFARAQMHKGFSVPHYHKKLTEYYLVLEGTGILRVKPNGGGKAEVVNLKKGIIVKIDPGEVHQSRSDGDLIVEDVSFPAWAEEDEFVVKKSLF